MRKLFLLGALLLIGACSTTTSHLSVIVPADADVSMDMLNERIVMPNVTGKDRTYTILFFPLGEPSFSEAVKNALHNGYAQVLTNAEIKYTRKWFLLYGYNQIEITADAVNLQ